jgi:predicted lipoprotein with Yx(FWY)xxD motif
MRRLVTILVPVVLLAAYACGDDDSGSGAATDTTAPTGTTGDDEGADDQADDAAGDPTVTVVESDLGEILADGDGRTLYLFTADDGGTSTCYDDCAEAWPPLEAPDGGPVAGDGVDEGLLGTTERDDGTEQVTYDGMPLYHFAGDSAPGDTNGQGVGGVWYVVEPGGDAVMAAAAGPGY